MLADALTLLLAIGAFLAGKYLGQNWMDPAMGVGGAIFVARWSFQRLRDTSSILLDAQAPGGVVKGVRDAIETSDGTELTDIHIWSIGPGIYAVALAVKARDPKSPGEYEHVIPRKLGIVHSNIAIHPAG